MKRKYDVSFAQSTVSNFRKNPGSISAEQSQNDTEHNHYAKIVSTIDNNYDIRIKYIYKLYIFKTRSLLQCT